MYVMRRTTIFLDEPLLRRLRAAAEREGRSFAALVRDALTAYLDGPRAGRRLPSIAGRFAGGRPDTSERLNELLRTDARSP
jgi:plasmid stability protein